MRKKRRRTRGEVGGGGKKNKVPGENVLARRLYGLRVRGKRERERADEPLIRRILKLNELSEKGTRI